MAAWCGLVLALLLVPVSNEYRAVWRTRLQDFVHVPLFFLLVAGLVWHFTWPGRRAFLTAVGLALLGELGQAACGRGASAADVLRGAIGAAVAALWLDPPRAMRRRRGRIATGAVLVSIPIVEVTPATIDALVAWQRFPILADFQTPFEPERWHRDASGKLRIVRRYLDSERCWVGELTCDPDAGGTADAILFPVIADWSDFYRFSLTAAVDSDDPIDLAVSVRDGIKLPTTARRFETTHRLGAGRNEIRIDLVGLARGDVFAPVDLGRVQSVHLIARNLNRPRRLLIYSIHLE